jgi:mono/diheme cytochrome c family protein
MKNTGMWTLLLILRIPPVCLRQETQTAWKEVYTKHCVACHGDDGNGNDKLAKVLNVTIPPLSSKEVQALSNDDLKKGVIEGKGKMKLVKGLSADVTNVIAFIRSLPRSSDLPPSIPGCG